MASCACKQFWDRVVMLPVMSNERRSRYLMEPVAVPDRPETQEQPHVERLFDAVRSFVNRECRFDEESSSSVAMIWAAFQQEQNEKTDGLKVTFGMFARILRSIGFMLTAGNHPSVVNLAFEGPADPDKLYHDLSLARHDAVMAEAALRAHLANNSLAAVPAGDFEALVVDTISLVGRFREALENLDWLSCRAKAMGVQS